MTKTSITLWKGQTSRSVRLDFSNWMFGFSYDGSKTPYDPLGGVFWLTISVGPLVFSGFFNKWQVMRILGSE